jgi:WD40 repeat protein
MRAIQFSPDGNTLIAGGAQAELLVYNVAARTLSKRISFGTEVSTCAFLPSSQFALLGGYDGRVELWDLRAGVRTVRYEGHRPATGNHNFLFHAAASADGSVLASASGDGHVKLWPVTPLEIRQLPTRESDQAVQLAERIRNWQPRKPVGTPIALKKVKTFEPHGEKVWFAIYSPDGKALATGGSDHTVKLWNAETMEVLLTLSGHGSFTTHAAFSPDGKKVATVSWTSKENLKLWDVQTGELLVSSDLHKNACRQVAFSPNGQWIATVCEDHFVRVFNTDLAMVSSADAGLNAYSVAFSPDSQILAVGTGNLVPYD